MPLGVTHDHYVGGSPNECFHPRVKLLSTGSNMSMGSEELEARYNKDIFLYNYGVGSKPKG